MEEMKRAIFRTAMKRSLNSFSSVESLSQLVRVANGDTRRLLSVVDPRAGMMLSTLLARLELGEFFDMFPKSKYSLATDLQRLQLKDYMDLYGAWQLRLERESIARGTNRGKGTKKPAVPMEALEAMYAAASPRMYVCNIQRLKCVQALLPLQEALSYEQQFAFIKAEFLSKFGPALQSKSSNLAITVLAESDKSYSNYMALGTPLCMAAVSRIFASVSKSSEVKPELLKRIGRSYATPEELVRNRQRVKTCLRMCEQAMERALLLTDAGLIARMLYSSAKNAFLYKRRFHYLYIPRNSLAASLLASKSNKRTTITKLTAVGVTAEDGKVRAGGLVISSLALRGEKKLQPIATSVNREFVGTAEYREVELGLCLCRLYLDSIERLYQADTGLRVLQCKFRYSVYKTLVRRARLSLFLHSEAQRYLHSRRTDYVRVRWDMFRRVEAVAVNMRDILSEKLVARQETEYRLKQMPRFGWTSFLDENELVYWVNKHQSSYETPLYTLTEWRAAQRLQRGYRRRLDRLVARRELMRIEQQRLVEIERRRAARYTLGMVSVSLTCGDEERERQIQEIGLPRRLQFDEDLVVRPRMWLLLCGDKEETHEHYEVVLVLRVKQGKCDVRTVRDEIISGVALLRLSRLLLDRGSIVEARYKGLVAFYRGRITSIHTSTTGEDANVRYDDGEFEPRVPLMFVRPPLDEVDVCLREKKAFLGREAQRVRRAEHYAALRQARIDSRLNQGEPTPVVNVHIKFTQKPLRFGWSPRREKGQLIYVNLAMGVKSTKAREYSAAESAAVVRIQGVGRIHVCRRKLRALLAKFTIDYICKGAIEDARKTAFIGYKLEGGASPFL
jgi:hypothetical protein